ncbi:hypothetical protein DV515_00018208, partial [Chloebia gouldiae]
MMLPNRCSFGAHQRMHRRRPPHVCPECGGNFLLANFEGHLKDSCLHFSRRVGYRCPSCSVVFGGAASIKSHIQGSHCEVFHKCPVCPMAFKSAPSAQAHVCAQHPGLPGQPSKMIYKCAMCDTVFTHKPLLSSHFDQHLLPQRVSVFRCPQCPLLFAQKRTMLEHLKNTHQPQKSKEDSSKKSPALLTPKPEPLETPVSKNSEESSSSTEEEEEAPSSPELRKARRSRLARKAGSKAKGGGWSCGGCQAWFPERDEYAAHMKREHGKSVKKFPCHLCERSFCSAPSLRRHVRVNHEGIKRVYPCRYSRESGSAAPPGESAAGLGRPRVQGDRAGLSGAGAGQGRGGVPRESGGNSQGIGVYCTEGKRTFSSRLILEKHIQVRHGIEGSGSARGHEVLIARGPPGPAQVGPSPFPLLLGIPGAWGRTGGVYPGIPAGNTQIPTLTSSKRGGFGSSPTQVGLSGISWGFLGILGFWGRTGGGFILEYLLGTHRFQPLTSSKRGGFGYGPAQGGIMPDFLG